MKRTILFLYLLLLLIYLFLANFFIKIKKTGRNFNKEVSGLPIDKQQQVFKGVEGDKSF